MENAVLQARWDLWPDSRGIAAAATHGKGRGEYGFASWNPPRMGIVALRKLRAPAPKF